MRVTKRRWKVVALMEWFQLVNEKCNYAISVGIWMKHLRRTIAWNHTNPNTPSNPKQDYSQFQMHPETYLKPQNMISNAWTTLN